MSMSKRLSAEKAAAGFLDLHHGPLVEMLVEVSGDLADELAGLGLSRNPGCGSRLGAHRRAQGQATHHPQEEASRPWAEDG